MNDTLITAPELTALLRRGGVAVLDARFNLADPEAGRRAYEAGHIPTAQYVDLDSDLSSPVHPGVTGRHPLPNVGAFVSTLRRLGVRQGQQVVVYDDGPGAIAARAWWLLRLVGHPAVAVLDGGYGAWLASGGAVSVDAAERPASSFLAQVRGELIIDASDAAAFAASPDCHLFDAREEARYWGLEEPIDPVAGRIPGAESLPFAGNLAAGRFLPKGELAERYRDALGQVPAEYCAAYCGSGVTACHTILAAHVAGFPDMRLYAGSFSEWITDPGRPVARGTQEP